MRDVGDAPAMRRCLQEAVFSDALALLPGVVHPKFIAICDPRLKGSGKSSVARVDQAERARTCERKGRASVVDRHDYSVARAYPGIEGGRAEGSARQEIKEAREEAKGKERKAWPN